MAQGIFDSLEQCNNTIIINNFTFDMLNESSKAFGNIVAQTTMYVQASLFRVTGSVSRRQFARLRRFALEGFRVAPGYRLSSAILFDSSMFHRVVPREQKVTKLVLHFTENARRNAKATVPKVWMKTFSGKSYSHVAHEETSATGDQYVSQNQTRKGCDEQRRCRRAACGATSTAPDAAGAMRLWQHDMSACACLCIQVHVRVLNRRAAAVEVTASGGCNRKSGAAATAAVSDKRRHGRRAEAMTAVSDRCNRRRGAAATRYDIVRHSAVSYGRPDFEVCRGQRQKVPCVRCVYISYGKEVGKKCKTPHLQEFVYFKNARSTKSVLKEFRTWARPAKSIHGAIRYTQKDGDFVERGTKPCTQEEKGERGAQFRIDVINVARESRHDDIAPDVLFRDIRTIEVHYAHAQRNRVLEDTTKTHL
eukprot:46367-Pleurochrysis_carterae.AAC.2